MTERHGGNLLKLALAAGKPVGEILDFSANINPLGPPEGFRSLISARTGDLVHYPDPDCTDLVRAFAARYRVAENEILMGNGSIELLYLLPQLLGKRRALIPVPAYVDYERAAELAGLAVERLPLREKEGFAPDLAVIAAALRGDEIVFLGRPNNPTGHLIPAAALRDLASSHPQTVFISDEAFADFAPEAETLIASGRPVNIIILKSLTKFYAMPGLRLGGVVAAPELIRRLRDRTPPWSVNTLAQAVGAAALRDTAYAEETLRFVRDRREDLFAALQALPSLTVYPGTANFLLLRSDRRNLDAPEIARRLLADGIAIRVCENFAGLDRRFFRIAVRTEAENDRLLVALRKVLGIANKKSGRRRTPAIMFQGTGSNAGKSILAAAMCRILLQDGFRVAPFKAQNMSLNSYVTRDGGEMGRAQVVQAQACRLDPDVRMNPVLLKPNSDTGSQVIILGKPVGNMDFWEYTRDRTPPFAVAREAYDSLAAEHDVIVLEGAGSPAEVNLKKRDIVNMNMALYAEASGPDRRRHRPGGRLRLVHRDDGVPDGAGKGAGQGVRREPLPGAGGVPRRCPRLHPLPDRTPRPRRRPLPARPGPPRGGLRQLQGRPDRRPRPRRRACRHRRRRSRPHLELHRLRPAPDRTGRPPARGPAAGRAGRAGCRDPSREQERDRRSGRSAGKRHGIADSRSRPRREDGDRRDLRRLPDPGPGDRRPLRDRVRRRPDAGRAGTPPRPDGARPGRRP